MESERRGSGEWKEGEWRVKGGGVDSGRRGSEEWKEGSVE